MTGGVGVCQIVTGSERVEGAATMPAKKCGSDMDLRRIAPYSCVKKRSADFFRQKVRFGP